MRILIADDDVTSRLSLRAMVAKLGHECLIATDGAGAWDALSAEPVDVLLTDWMMPGLDGPELCRRVRDEPDWGHLYIVIITALGSPEEILEGMGAGADDYLIKPVNPFAVQTRLVAAERVTNLRRQVDHFQERLEAANLELLSRSLTDELTGLGNRRRMNEDLRDAHALAVELGRGYSVALFDVDHFKRFNDHAGHLAGDRALHLVAQSLLRSAGPERGAYRYGGEEFLVVLPGCDLDAATIVAGRLVGAVESLAIPHLARPDDPPVVTVSAGAASWTPAEPSSLAELLARADRALFEAKSSGRNRVRSDRESSPAGA